MRIALIQVHEFVEQFGRLASDGMEGGFELNV